MRRALLVLGSLVLAAALAGCGGGADRDGAPAAGASDIAASTEATVRFWEERAERDPRDFVALNQLADSYLRRARQSSAIEDYARAETALLASLAARPEGNYEAFVQLGLVYIAMHRFEEVLPLAGEAIALKPSKPAGYAVLGDALLSVGRYDEAEDAYRTLLGMAPGLASYSRIAHIRELRGDLEGAERAWRDAAEVAGVRRAEDVAWARSQLGHFYLEYGNLEAAEEALEGALDVLPGFTAALTGLAEVRLAEGDFEAAIELYERALALRVEIDHVIELGDVYAVAGEPELAAEQYARVDQVAAYYEANGLRVDLILARYLADHDLRPAEALERARAAYQARPGIDSADALAWALFRNGRYAEASGYAEEALRVGNEDPEFLYHAGLIREANGDLEGARAALSRALERNPQFSLLHAPLAAAALERLEATAAGAR